MEQTDKIERLEAFEERADVELAALYAELLETDTGKKLWVSGEIRALSGVELPEKDGRWDLRIEIAVYNQAGRVIGTTGQSWKRSEFFAFQPFELVVQVSPEHDPARIRVYPK